MENKKRCKIFLNKRFKFLQNKNKRFISKRIRKLENLKEKSTRLITNKITINK